MPKLKYDPETFPDRVEELARDGYADQEIFPQLGISKDAFYRYLKNYPEFAEALKRGREPINAKVEKALLKRCLGFEVEETNKRVHQHIRRFTRVRFNKDGTKDVFHELKPVETRTVSKTTKNILPSEGACLNWLRAKKPEVWKEKKEIDIKGFRTFADLMLEITKNGKKNNGK